MNLGGVERTISHDIAIDLGTANTLVAVEGKGLIVNEPSVVAINTQSRHIIAMGEQARAMLGKTPPDIQAARPLVDGVVSDFEISEAMLRHYVDKIHSRFKVMWPRPRIIIGLPSGVTEVEQRAVEEAARSAGARKIYLIEEPVAAAIGVGLSVNDSAGHMIVDIGGGTTEVAVIAGGRTIAMKSLRIAGDELTEAIMHFMREEYNVHIGEQTAERVKMQIGAVYTHSDTKSTHVRGRNMLTGLPQEVVITSDALRSPLARHVRPVVDSIRAALEEAPADIVADIMKSGIYIAGGGGLIAGLDRLVRQETKIETHIAHNALTAVVEGSARVLSQLPLYEDILVNKSRV